MSDLDELEAEIERWDPRAKAKLGQLVSGLDLDNIQHWYCTRGRRCDGKPHPGYDYKHARSDQWPPPGTDWFLWFLMSGRGAGKTRSGSGWTRRITQYVDRIAIIGRRNYDVRYTMIEGRSGLIKACEAAGETYDWKPAAREFTFQNGAKVFGYSGEEPDQLRGPEHGAAWLDEPAHMPLINEVWYNLGLGLRIPGMPGGAKILCTSTPLPTKWVREQSSKKSTRLVRVSTHVNIDNLDEAYLENVVRPLEGTRIGQQELEGEILEDVEGSLWKYEMLQRAAYELSEMIRTVVAIDPAGSANRRSDETGIVGAGLASDGKGVVLDDKSGRYTPQGWARAAIGMYETLQADAIVVETNFGGDMVRTTLRAEGFEGRIIESRATRGKQLRAEPVVALYEQKKVVHLENAKLADLETEMTTWVPGVGDSPNRVDAVVWALTELLLKGSRQMQSARAQGKLPSNTPGVPSPGQPSRRNTHLNPIAALQQRQREQAARRKEMSK